MTVMTQLDRIKGAIFGMAIGDAYGYPTEFLSIAEIEAKWPPNGPDFPEGNPVLVTDDTQMAIAAAQALMEATAFTVEALTPQFIKTYLLWLNDPRNNRAPGMTCLTSLEKLAQGKPWLEATNRGSKGCGANMRVVPVGCLAPKVPLPTIAKIAQLQSAITHGHPTALVASAITAITIAYLVEGTVPADLLPRLRHYITEQRETYYETWLGAIWDRPPFRSATDFIRLGWDEVSAMLDKVEQGLLIPDTSTDPCEVVGAGWIAEESFATALYCFLLFPTEADKAIRRAAISSGDSDSIACLAGAFAGAHNGIASLPADWVERIEYRQELEEIVAFYIELQLRGKY